MGFHNRTLTKEIILTNLHNIDSLLNADAFITDSWSSKFIKDINRKERLLREKIKLDNQFQSGCPNKHIDYSKLESLSETLISLKTNPDWLDIHFTQDKLGRFHLEIHEMGVFEVLIEKSIDAIIIHFE